MRIDQAPPQSKIKSSGVGLTGFIVILVFLITTVAVMGNPNKPSNNSGAAAATAVLTARPTSTGDVVTDVKPPVTCGYCQSNLVGKTTDEIGQYAVQYAQQNNYVLEGSPQVLVSRSITPDQFTNLGLGCLTNIPTIEEPPLVLVLMKGHFNFNKGLTSSVGVFDDPKLTSYLTLVFDLWAGLPSDWRLSSSTDELNALLNGTPATPYPCLQRTPADQKTLHYGDAFAAPTVTPQTSVAVETAVTKPSNQAALPTPVSTAAVPVENATK